MLTFDNKKFSNDLRANVYHSGTDKIKYREISDATGISKFGVWNILNNAAIPQLNTFAAICSWMGKEPNDYFVNNN